MKTFSVLAVLVSLVLRLIAKQGERRNHCQAGGGGEICHIARRRSLSGRDHRQSQDRRDLVATFDFDPNSNKLAVQ
jgi:hypothetical protein